MRRVPVLLVASVSSAALAADWRELEAPLLSGHVQLTTEADFVKAGEAYFSPNADWIIFQAVPAPDDGAQPDIHYSMYIAPLERDASGGVSP